MAQTDGQKSHADAEDHRACSGDGSGHDQELRRSGQTNDLQEIFDLADCDKDGAVSRRGLSQAIMKYSSVGEALDLPEKLRQEVS